MKLHDQEETVRPITEIMQNIGKGSRLVLFKDAMLGLYAVWHEPDNWPGTPSSRGGGSQAPRSTR